MEISQRTGALWSEEKRVFSLKFLKVEYSVSFPDFQVIPLCESDCDMPFPLVTMNDARILVMRFLLEGCSSLTSGKFLTFRQVPTGEVYDRQFNGRCVTRLARTYGNCLDVFSLAMERLGALRIKAADSGYEIELMDGYLIRFLLWAGDDEFPPSAQILFSDNFVSSFRAEDLVVSCDVILNTLKGLHSS